MNEMGIIKEKAQNKPLKVTWKAIPKEDWEHRPFFTKEQEEEIIEELAIVWGKLGMSDKIIIDFNGKEENSELPDISYEHFLKSLFERGSSDLTYDQYLKNHNMQNLTDFNFASTAEIDLVIAHNWRNRVLRYKCVYDSDNDEEFDGDKYFKRKEDKRNE